MVAADLFNQADGRPEAPIFGCVTTGENWQFMKLGGGILLDRKEYYLNERDDLLSIFVHMNPLAQVA